MIKYRSNRSHKIIKFRYFESKAPTETPELFNISVDRQKDLFSNHFIVGEKHCLLRYFYIEKVLHWSVKEIKFFCNIEFLLNCLDL